MRHRDSSSPCHRDGRLGRTGAGSWRMLGGTARPRSPPGVTERPHQERRRLASQIEPKAAVPEHRESGAGTAPWMACGSRQISTASRHGRMRQPPGCGRPQTGPQPLEQPVEARLAAGSRGRRRSSRRPGSPGAGYRTAPLPGRREPGSRNRRGRCAWRPARWRRAGRSRHAHWPAPLPPGEARRVQRDVDAQPAACERRRDVARVLEPRLPRRLQGRQQARLRHVGSGRSRRNPVSSRTAAIPAKPSARCRAPGATIRFPPGRPDGERPAGAVPRRAAPVPEQPVACFAGGFLDAGGGLGAGPGQHMMVDMAGAQPLADLPAFESGPARSP